MTTAIKSATDLGNVGTARPRNGPASGPQSSCGDATREPGGKSWELEWRSARGGTIRRLTISRRVVLGLILAFTIASSAVAAGGVSAGLERLRAHDSVVAARQENRSLRARQEALCQCTPEKTERSQSSARGERQRREVERRRSR